MIAKIQDVVINLSKVAAKASVEDQPLVATLARETLRMAEVLQKIVEGNATAIAPPLRKGGPGGVG